MAPRAVRVDSAVFVGPRSGRVNTLCGTVTGRSGIATGEPMGGRLCALAHRPGHVSVGDSFWRTARSARVRPSKLGNFGPPLRSLATHTHTVRRQCLVLSP